MDAASWARAKEVLAEALKRPRAEREEFVQSQALPSEVRDKVLEILSAWVDSTEFLRSDSPGGGSPLAALVDQTEVLPPGARVGAYVVVDQIGMGGMGRVYLANDPQLHRKVALKCLLAPSSGRPDALIINEAIAAARVSHANVAGVHHVIEHGQQIYIVMEYVDGENLATRLKRERLPIEQVVAIGQQLASALTAAHAKGIIHRDLKPGNVQFTYDGMPKVLDFGIADLAMTMTVTSNATTARAANGGNGPHPGTPPYMSPEQLQGLQVDERSDIFSLGVLLFEMATGRRPFPAAEHEEIIQLQSKGAPRADTVDPRVPRALAEVIARSLDTDRTRRLQSARELEAGLDVVAVKLRPKPLRELIRLWLARVAIGVPIAVVAIGLIGFIATMGFNTTFGRDAEFARFGVEPLPDTFTWGVLAVFPALITMTLTAALFLAARSGFRFIEAVGPVGRGIRAVRLWLTATLHEVGLDTSPVLAQALAGFGVVGIGLLYLSFFDLVTAWSSFINSAQLEQLVPIGPHAAARDHYHRFQFVMHALILVTGLGLIKVLQLRRAEQSGEGTASVVALGVVLAVMLVISNFPYRTMNHRDRERVELKGIGRCYITGQTSDEFLVFCPQSAPPRNRAVRRNDEALTRTGVVENVFESLRPSPSGTGS